jgi:hypothetical protein
MKMLNSTLKINTYGTVFEDSESLSIVKKVFIPEKATEKELAIHSFLSRMGVYQVNVKNMLEEDAKSECKSPRLAQEFNKI